MAEEKEKPLTREDVKSKIEEHGGSEGLDLSGREFEEGIDLREFRLHGIILRGAFFKRSSIGGLADLTGEVDDEQAREVDIEEHRADAHLEKAWLEDAHLEEVWLEGAHLEEADLSNAHSEGAYLANTHLEGAFLPGIHLEGADLADANLEGANLWYAHLEGAYLADAKFSRDTKLESVDWGNHILGCEKREEFFMAADTYRKLKTWYTQHGMYDTAGEFFFREREATRKRLRVFYWQKEANRKRLKFSKEEWNHRLALQGSYLVFGHGERWRRIPLWMAFLLILFAAAYYFLGGLGPLDSLYFSAVSFTALGYGSWAPEPIGWVKGLGAFEAFIGVIMMALLLVTFVRKWSR